MELVKIPNLSQSVCRIGLGTWAIGGALWGGTDEKESIATLHRAFDLGINLIDTAPSYGFGLSEEIVGKALKSYTGNRARLVIATKVGLDWREGTIFRDCRRERIFQEIEDSLKRLKVDCIDLYQVHWPDFDTPFHETAAAMRSLMESGKIKAIGVSNYTIEMIEEFRKIAPVHALQSSYNLFEREIEALELPYCKKNGIALLGYGPLCRGLLSGRMRKSTKFEGDDLRKIDPKFQEPNFSHYLNSISQLQAWVAGKYGRTILELALRFVMDKGIDIPLWGARRPQQLDLLEKVWDWTLSPSDLEEIDQIINESIAEPLGPEFMAPSMRKEVLQSM
jgi:aryl-alcohol dehydrogenase-like predicted oxidoreductase